MSVDANERLSIGAEPALDLAIRRVRTAGEFAAMLEVRRRVFGLEQDMIASNTTDRDDQRSHLLLATIEDGAVGTARLSPPTTSRPEGHIAWVAVLPHYRHRGAGTALMDALLEIADRALIEVVTLSAQTHALPFYRRFGFTPYGNRFVVRGIEHQAMARRRS